MVMFVLGFLTGFTVYGFSMMAYLALIRDAPLYQDEFDAEVWAENYLPVFDQTCHQAGDTANSGDKNEPHETAARDC